MFRLKSQNAALGTTSEGKAERLPKAFQSHYAVTAGVVTGTGSTARLQLTDESIDYIFTDPPFGENIYYADLNFLVESWYGVVSNAAAEAIVDKVKNKGLPEYQELMRRCFAEYYRVLKPGRWITIVFHNSHNAVWNAIQEALCSVGFVVADVRTLDKQQGSYRQVTSKHATKQDLVITAYKANGGLEERFKFNAGTDEGVWDFVRTHLNNLPVFVNKGGKSEVIAERKEYLLYDRMVAFHVQRGVAFPFRRPNFIRVCRSASRNATACTSCPTKRLNTTKNGWWSTVSNNLTGLCRMRHPPGNGCVNN